MHGGDKYLGQREKEKKKSGLRRINCLSGELIIENISEKANNR
jgi:hypothetical protein